MVIELDTQFKKQRDIIEEIILQVVNKHHLDITHTTIHNLSIHLTLYSYKRKSNKTFKKS